MTMTRSMMFFASASALLLNAACSSSTGLEGLPSGEFHRVRLEDPQTTPRHDDPVEAARDFLRSVHTDIGLTSEDELVLKSATRGTDGLWHIRFDQRHRQVPVWGADLVVHVSDDRIWFAAGTLARGLTGIEVDPLVAADFAMELSKTRYLERVTVDDALIEFARTREELVLFGIDDEPPRLAWHVVFFTELQAGVPPGLWNTFVDARRGNLLFAFNAIDTLAQASGPGGNAKVPRQWSEELDVEAAGAQYQMQTTRLKTIDMKGTTSGSGSVVTGPLLNIGDAAINDAHGFAEATLNMMKEWFGYDSLDGHGFPVVSRVHYGNHYENAFWDGTQMTYGDGDTLFYPLSGDVDVVAHEMNHGFTAFHSNLAYYGMSGGMNESFSDIAGTIAAFYRVGDGGDWTLGADIFKNPTGALRYMCDPPQDGHSLDHAAEFTPGTDVHYSSGVGNKAFCLASRRLATGTPDGTATAQSVRRAGQAWYLANVGYWTESSDFTQTCQGVLDAAAALGFTDDEQTALRDSWVDVGVGCDGAVVPLVCDEILTEESGWISSPNYPENYPNGVKYRWCIAPASGRPAVLTFDTFNTEEYYDFVEIKDGNGVQLSNTSGSRRPPPATASVLIVLFTSDNSVVQRGFHATWTTSEIR